MVCERTARYMRYEAHELHLAEPVNQIRHMETEQISWLYLSVVSCAMSSCEKGRFRVVIITKF